MSEEASACIMFDAATTTKEDLKQEELPFRITNRPIAYTSL